jgi:hypothetical protein
LQRKPLLSGSALGLLALIPISLVDLVFGEEKAHACEIALIATVEICNASFVELERQYGRAHRFF